MKHFAKKSRPELEELTTQTAVIAHALGYELDHVVTTSLDGDRFKVFKDGQPIGYVFPNERGTWTSSLPDWSGGSRSFSDHKTRELAIVHLEEHSP